MGLSRPVVDRLIKSVPEKLVGFNRDNLISETIGTAFYDLGFNRAKADNIGSYLIKQNPSITGIVYDETPNRKTRTELTSRATSFSTNQRFESGSVVTPTGKTALSVGFWFDSASGHTGEFLNEYETTTNDRSWRVWLDSGKPYVVLSEGGLFSGATTKKIVTTDVIADSTFHYFMFTWSATADEVLIYIDGKQVATTAIADVSIASIYDGDIPLRHRCIQLHRDWFSHRPNPTTANPLRSIHRSGSQRLISRRLFDGRRYRHRMVPRRREFLPADLISGSNHINRSEHPDEI